MVVVGHMFPKKMISVENNDQFHVKIGSGGNSREMINGCNTYLRQIRNNICVCELVMTGGQNGYPLYENIEIIPSQSKTKSRESPNLSGGLGGINNMSLSINGVNGEDGVFGISRSNNSPWRKRW